MRFKIFFKRQMFKKIIIFITLYVVHTVRFYLKNISQLFYYFEIVVQNIRQKYFLIVNLIRC